MTPQTRQNSAGKNLQHERPTWKKTSMNAGHPACVIADKRVGRAAPGTEPDTNWMPSSPDGTITMLHHPPFTRLRSVPAFQTDSKTLCNNADGIMTPFVNV
ncbi:DNA polymerase IV [Clarias magur]|uniref:DNA polymerase IV n=1 Tax=Clarias magur TaxID=1594786 RepID=A0A8J4UQU0_CLAMG|nr:DNA polymerase IV [Clarias magur]